MYNNIKDVFAHYFADTKFDAKLYKSIVGFAIGWMNKSDEYTEFLGSNLLGVHLVKFSTRDEDILFTDVLGIPLKKLTMDIHALKDINTNWKVSSNPTYLTLIYMMHRFILSKDINDKDREDALIHLYYIFAYKAISSLISNGFRHALKESIAKIAYEKLSNKYILKQKGTWNGFFNYRAQDVIPPKGIHYKDRSIVDLTTKDAIKIANDLQGRIRDTFKNIYNLIMDILSKDSAGISTTSMIAKDIEGTESNKDIITRPDKYILYLKDIIHKPNDFLANDVLVIVSSIMPNLDPELLKITILNISNNNNLVDKNKHDIFSSIIISNIKYLNDKGHNSNYMDNILDVMITLRNYWSSSRITDKVVIDIKKDLNDIVKKSIKQKTSWVITTVAIGLALYIFLRALIKKH